MTRWVSRLSLRARLMVIGMAGLTIGLGLGGIVFLGALTYSLNRTLDNEATASAAEVQAMVDHGDVPEPIPVSGAQVVQVIDGQGRIRAASVGADRLVPLLRPGELAAARAGKRLDVPGDRVGVDGALRVVAVPAGPASDPQTVVVALQVGDARRSVALVRDTLLVAYPLLVGLLAVLAWRVIGSTLRPVEALRAGAERISGTGRADRLPVPESADEVRALAVTLNGMLDRLAAGRDRQRAFVADAAHELRSPLASMRTQLEVARHLRAREPAGSPAGGGLPDPERDALLDDLLIDVQRLSALVDDLLLLARLDADVRPPASRRPVDIGALLADAAARCAAARVPVRVVPGPALTVEADPAELPRALGNLLDNAVRHARTEVRLDAVPDGDRVLVTVTDDGPGIDAADRERVFDRFTRLDDARSRDAGGTGLGLAIARELIRRAGGTVRLADAEPGLRAEVRLPL